MPKIYMGLTKGICASCKEILYVNPDTGMCIACENTHLREAIAVLSTMLHYERRETSRLLKERLAVQKQDGANG